MGRCEGPLTGNRTEDDALGHHDLHRQRKIGEKICFFLSMIMQIIPMVMCP